MTFPLATLVSTISVLNFFFCLKLCVPRNGSVIADLQLKFERSIYEEALRGLLQDAAKDGKLGELEVEQVVVGKFIGGELLCLKSPRYLVAVR